MNSMKSMNELSMEHVLENRSRYNLAIPFTETRQMNPFYKISVQPLFADTSEQAGDIYKVGSKCVSNDKGENKRWIELYSVTKPFLERLATLAGIQIAPGIGDVVKMDANTWKAKCYGALQLPDGSVRTSENFKVIDLAMEEKKYRILYEEKSAEGISDYKTASDAAARYAGEWVDTGRKNEKGYPVRKFVIAQEDRGRYVEKSLLDAMAQLRANAPQKAATGAMLRVIRDLLGIKGTYTMEELKRPFVVARMSFSPDYNDPVIKQMLLQQAIRSVGNLFGNVQPVVQTLTVAQTDDIENEVDIPAEAGFSQNEGGNEEKMDGEPKKDAAPEPYYPPEPERNDFYCDKCGEQITEKIWDYSVQHYERPLCYKCQRIVRGNRR